MKRAIAIAGGGLAGLSLGIALRRREIPVTVIEAGAYPRHRVCGEFISGVGDATLENLGILEILNRAERLSGAIWHDARGVVTRMDVEARGLSRWELDAALAEEFVRCGGDLRTGCRTADTQGIVVAFGRPRRNSGWMGLKMHVRGLSLRADLEMHCGTNGYAGLARVGDGLVNVCGLFRTSGRGSGRGPDLLMATLERGGLFELAGRLRAARPDHASFCSIAGFLPGWTARHDGELRIGDAAHVIPPFTGNGMSMAFESAACAVEPLAAYAHGQGSWQEAARVVQSAQTGLFRRRMLVANGLHGALTSPFTLGVSRLAAARGLLPAGRLLSLIR